MRYSLALLCASARICSTFDDGAGVLASVLLATSSAYANSREPSVIDGGRVWTRPEVAFLFVWRLVLAELANCTAEAAIDQHFLLCKDPTRECFLSIPTVVGVGGAESVLEIRPHLNYAEAQKYDATADTLEHMCAQLPPVGPMSRTDALDAGAARKEAYEEAA